MEFALTLLEVMFPDIDEIINLGIRVYEVAGWHTELYINAGDLKELYTKLIKLPLLCIDHLGITKNWFQYSLKLSRERCASKSIWVWASRF